MRHLRITKQAWASPRCFNGSSSVPPKTARRIALICWISDALSISIGSPSELSGVFAQAGQHLADLVASRALPRSTCCVRQTWRRAVESIHKSQPTSTQAGDGTGGLEQFARTLDAAATAVFSASMNGWIHVHQVSLMLLCQAACRGSPSAPWSG